MLNHLSLGLLPTVSFDRAYGDRSLRNAAVALSVKRDWRPARELLIASDGDWALKDHYVQYLSSKSMGRPILRRWAESDPQSSDPLTVLSRAEVWRAWAVRGKRRAQYVRKSAWPKFFEILTRADDLAAQAAHRAPHDPTPRATSLAIARGLQVPRREFDARWEALTACDPLHRNGHRHALQYLCAKWSGSHREMFRFARNAAQHAPAGHPLVVLPLLANLELRLADDNLGLGSARFHTDLTQLQERWIQPGPLQHPRIVEDHALIAFYLHLLERHSDAATHFRAMGRNASTEGWYYNPTPRFDFLAARATALRARDSGKAVS